MSDVTVVPPAVEAFGRANASSASAVLAAGSFDAAATTAAMIGVFGVIGQEFLASFIAAQANHLLAVGNLAAVHAGTASATHAGLGRFETGDAAAGAAIREAR